LLIVFFGWIIPISLFELILSLIIEIYLGSNIFKGTVVLGNIIKLLIGKTGIVFGRLFIFIIML
jgi:hypothetical protein